MSCDVRSRGRAFWCFTLLLLACVGYILHAAYADISNGVAILPHMVQPRGSAAVLTPLDTPAVSIEAAGSTASSRVVDPTGARATLAAPFTQGKQDLSDASGHQEIASTASAATSPPHCDDWMTIWSRGIARACCDIYPSHFIGERALALAVSDRLADQFSELSGFRGGTLGCLMEDLCSNPSPKTNTYDVFVNALSKVKGIRVYVSQRDFGRFVNKVFLKLPSSASLVLVVAQEDGGAPMELFGQADRTSRSIGGLPPLRGFLADSRLQHMYVQNYDLVGCHLNYMNSERYKHHGCNYTVEESLQSKVSPIPIGLDYHTADEKKRLSQKPQDAIPVCMQQRVLDTIAEAAPSWQNRQFCMAISFNGAHYETRVDLLNNLRMHPNICREHLARNRNKMWERLSKFAFAFAPSGAGIDTHRFWETLSLGTVPVVVAMSLSVLYTQFPVVVLNSWDDVAAPNAIQRWREDIERRFGKEPFASGDVRHRLSVRYWADVIRNGSIS